MTVEERHFDSPGIILGRTSIMTGNARQAVVFGEGAIKKGKEAAGAGGVGTYQDAASDSNATPFIRGGV